MRCNIMLDMATGASRLQKTAQNTRLSWEDFIAQVLKPVIRTPETMAQYKSLSKAEKGSQKDAGWYILGYLKDGSRKELVSRSAVALDIDSPGEDTVQRLRNMRQGAWALVTTHSSTPEAPRYRCILPLDRTVSPEEYQAIARRLAAMLDIEAMDPSTYEPARIMYRPSVPKDAPYQVEVNDAPPWGAGKLLATYENWQDVSTWPHGSQEAKALKILMGKKQADPTTKEGLIGAFCRVYDIPAAIDKFLPDMYTPSALEGRYTYTKGTTTSGGVVYDGIFFYSHHGTDPLRERLLNAFDLVRLGLYRTLDEGAADNTPVNKLPSYVAMMALARKDRAVWGEYQSAQAVSFSQMATGSADTVPEDWVKKLEFTGGAKNPRPAPTAGNYLLILQNDPGLKGAFGHNLFNDRLTLLKSVPWRTLKNDSHGEPWTDADDSGLRNYLAVHWKTPGNKQTIDDALTETMEKQAYHPVRDYLAGLKWDGTPRAESLFIRWLKADDTPYTKEVTLKWLKAAVTRIYDPGHKFDYVLVLDGPQGIGKSTVLNLLGVRWYTDSFTSFRGKDAMEILPGNWIIELSEMVAAYRAENGMIKAFLSRQVDQYRAAFAHRVKTWPRQNVWAATTNDSQFLKDTTGNRRFWVIDCRGRGDTLEHLDKDYVSQIWAEVLVKVKQDPTLELSPAAEDEAIRIQEMHTEGQEKAGLIEAFLNKPLPPDWKNKSIDARKAWLRAEGASVATDTKGMVPRNQICTLELWCELFDRRPGDLKAADARGLNDLLRGLKGWEAGKSPRHMGPYGKQRVFIRVVNNEKMETDWKR